MYTVMLNIYRMCFLRLKNCFYRLKNVNSSQTYRLTEHFIRTTLLILGTNPFAIKTASILHGLDSKKMLRVWSMLMWFQNVSGKVDSNLGTGKVTKENWTQCHVHETSFRSWSSWGRRMMRSAHVNHLSLTASGWCLSQLSDIISHGKWICPDVQAV